MNYPCKMIQDLLPLYIDGICSEESKHATEKHLAECEACRNCHEAMNTTVDVVKLTPDNSEEIQKINSLKKVKKKLNQKLCAIFGGMCCYLRFLFTVFCPNKEGTHRGYQDIRGNRINGCISFKTQHAPYHK